MSEPILRAHSLTKTYGPTPAVDGVRLAIEAGTSTAVMGASGSGKTTLLHLLAGIITPDAGDVVYGGHSIGSLGDAQRSRLRLAEFGFVFQQGMLLPELTAIENVALPLMLQGRRRSEAFPRAAGWLARLGLESMLERRIGQLSGGQAQRVAIARAQVTGARVTFADEPTGALDSATSDEVMDALLANTVGQGRTLVLVTHDRDLAGRCGRVITLHDGRIVADTLAIGRSAA